MSPNQYRTAFQTVVCSIFILLIGSGALAQSVSINEWMIKNSTGISDEDGEHSDWVELYNGQSTSIDLSGYGISDEEGDPYKWVFPTVTIQPGEFLLVFCSDKDRNSGPFLHTNFKLSASDDLLITDADGNLAAEVEIHSAPYDVSEGSVIDGSEETTEFYVSTPSASNLGGINYNELTASHFPGFYTGPFELSVAGSEAHQIHYTTDGSVPGLNDPVWTGPVSIIDRSGDANGISEIQTNADNLAAHLLWESPTETVFKGTVLRLRSFEAGQPSSHTLNLSYFIHPMGADRYSLAVISLITDSLNLFSYDTGIYVPGIMHDIDPNGGNPAWGTGNYHESGDHWERDCHLQFFNENGDLLLTQDLGMRIHGAGSRALPQKSLRLYAREKYGESKIELQVFPQIETDEFDVLVLRNMGQDLLTGVAQDALANQLIIGLNQAHLEYRPVVVFVNGEYWGIQNLRERFDKHFLSAFHELPKDSIDMIDSYYGSPSIGDAVAYDELYNFIDSNDLSIQNNYDQVSARMDIADFIDNTLTRIYLGCYDWPGNNIKIWRERSPEGKFRWLLLDNDGCISDAEFNTLEHATEANAPGWPNPPESTLFLRKLLANDGFKEQFINRMVELLNTAFDKVSVGTLLSEFYDIYAPEYEEHDRRWNMLQEGETLLSNYESKIETIRKRSCFIREHFMSYFSLSEAEFAFSCDSSQLTLGMLANESESLILFPNPNNGRFSVVLPEEHTGSSVLTVYDMTGRSVLSKRLDPSSDHLYPVDITGVAAGIYSAQIQLDNRLLRGPVVVSASE